MPTLVRRLTRARAWSDAHLATDRALMALHARACAAHSVRIAELLSEPEFRDRRDWILAESW